jgi:hypothetical protein
MIYAGSEASIALGFGFRVVNAYVDACDQNLDFWPAVLVSREGLSLWPPGFKFYLASILIWSNRLAAYRRLT